LPRAKTSMLVLLSSDGPANRAFDGANDSGNANTHQREAKVAGLSVD
jgi:hypothetical protein